jgi:4a-hydroxytetrahydrobiopterin dehydratase
MSERVMAQKLEQRHCTPCRGGVPPLGEAAAARYLVDLPDWQLADDAKRISRDFRFKNFAQALAFVNEVGAIAEGEGHHPDVSFGWGYASITLQTHKIDGLHENDFILAAKIDAVAPR